MNRRSFRMGLLAASALTMVVAAPAGARDTGYLFVSSEKDNEVTVLDGRSYEVVTRIGTAARPRHLAFNPDRTRIYAACGDGDAIDIIDVASLTLVDRIDAIDDPELFDLSADGRFLYISLEDDAKLGILDLEAHLAARDGMPDLTAASPSADDDDGDDDDDDDDDGDDDDDDDGDDEFASVPGLTVIETGDEPEGVLAGPDGRTVYVTSEVANLVHVIDLATSAIVKNVVAGNRPRRFALSPDGSRLWVTNELGGSATVLATHDYSTVATVDFLPRGLRREDVTPVGITFTDDGETVIVALGRANHVAFVNAASHEVEDYVLVGSRAWNLALDRDNRRLVVANGLSDDISIIDMESRKVERSVRVGRVPHTVLIDD
ncbi:MAG: beta-propeller fold lactonase family protein [Alphaproteobacteria bacterium]|nr:beta-propeller fold lactonase family protein [Alphaproteobacteria bacterium]